MKNFRKIMPGLSKFNDRVTFPYLRVLARCRARNALTEVTRSHSREQQVLLCIVIKNVQELAQKRVIPVEGIEAYILYTCLCIYFFPQHKVVGCLNSAPDSVRPSFPLCGPTRAEGGCGYNCQTPPHNKDNDNDDSKTLTTTTTTTITSF